MINRNDKIIAIPRESGFTVLFAILISSLLLAVAVSIYNISLKELLISSSLQHSQSAFYAADSGLDCFLYNDFKNNSFDINQSAERYSGSLSCQNISSDTVSDKVGDEVVDLIWDHNGERNKYFYLNDDVNGPCFSVKFSKTIACSVETIGVEPDTQTLKTCNFDSTDLDIRGYDTCDLESDTRTERGIHVTY